MSAVFLAMAGGTSKLQVDGGGRGGGGEEQCDGIAYHPAQISHLLHVGKFRSIGHS